jgi:hypothetical protein
MNPHPLAPSPNLPRLFHPAYWLSGEGGQKASLRLAGATPGWSLKGPTLGAGQLAEGRWDLILWKPLPPEMEHTRTAGDAPHLGGANPPPTSPDAAAAHTGTPFQSEESTDPHPNAIPPQLALISTLKEKSLRALRGPPQPPYSSAFALRDATHR